MKTNEINDKITEGQHLLGAVAILTTTIHTDKTPDEVMLIIKEAASKMNFNKEELVSLTKEEYIQLKKDQSDLHLVRDWAKVTVMDSFSYKEEVVDAGEAGKRLRTSLQFDVFMLPMQFTQFSTLVRDIFTLRNPTKFQ